MIIDLKGRKAVVTGSTAGIGRAIAEGLARAGAAVVINGRGEERVAAALREMRALFPTADIKGFAADLATEKGAAAFTGASSGRRYSRQQYGHGEAEALSRTDRRRLAGSVRDQRDERGQNDPPLSSGDDQARLGARSVHQQRVRVRHPERDDRLRHDEDRAARDRQRRGGIGRRHGRHRQLGPARPDKLRNPVELDEGEGRSRGHHARRRPSRTS